MDQKYFSEIKARDAATIPDTAAPAFRDRHTLIAEVERLTAENTKLKESTLDPVELAKVAIALQENTTLKKALELMAKYIVEQGNCDISLCDDIPNELHLKYQPQNDGNYENGPCIQCVKEYFKNQAEQLTHETHEEVEK